MSLSTKIIPFNGGGNKPKSPAKAKRFSKKEVKTAQDAILRAYPPAGARRIA